MKLKFDQINSYIPTIILGEPTIYIYTKGKAYKIKEQSCECIFIYVHRSLLDQSKCYYTKNEDNLSIIISGCINTKIKIKWVGIHHGRMNWRQSLWISTQQHQEESNCKADPQQKLIWYEVNQEERMKETINKVD